MRNHPRPTGHMHRRRGHYRWENIHLLYDAIAATWRQAWDVDREWEPCRMLEVRLLSPLVIVTQRVAVISPYGHGADTQQ